MKSAENGRYVYVNQPYEQTFESQVQAKRILRFGPEYARELSANDFAEKQDLVLRW